MAKEPKFFTLDQPVFDGLQVQVQHPSSSGKPPTEEPGHIGVSVIVPGEYPVFVLHIAHADGTQIAAMLTPSDVLSFIEIAKEKAVEVGAIGMSIEGLTSERMQ